LILVKLKRPLAGLFLFSEHVVSFFCVNQVTVKLCKIIDQFLNEIS